MSQKRPSSREELIYHLHDYHLDTCDVVLVPKPSTDDKKDDSDQNSNYGTKAHSSVLTFYSPVLKELLKGMLKSEGLYQVNIELDISTQGIQAFVNCLYKKPIKTLFDHVIISDALKLASFYQVPIFIFEELFSNKSIYLYLEECLKREKEEVKTLLESCREMIETNYAIYEDKLLFQDLNLDLFHWLAALEELPIPNLAVYLMDFAMDEKHSDQEIRQVLSKAKSEVEKHERRVSEVLKIEKSGNGLPPEKFSIRYKNQTISEVLSKASSYSSDKFLPEHSHLYLQKNPDKDLETSSFLVDHEIKPGDIVCIKVKNQIEICLIDGKREKIFVHFHGYHVRDLKVQISDLFETKDINTIRLMKDQKILDDMQKLEDVLKEGNKVVSASFCGDPVDAARVVVGYGEENAAAWPGVVITADSTGEQGREPGNALKGSTFSWASKATGSVDERWWQCEFAFPVVIGLFQFSAIWNYNQGKEHHHATDFKIDTSVDGKNWTCLIDEVGIGDWQDVKTFTCQNVKAFRYYRITSFKTTNVSPVIVLHDIVFSESLF